jgi:hypothetical protein
MRAGRQKRQSWLGRRDPRPYAHQINGLRHPITEGTTGWYIWCGEQLAEAGDFFQPLCVDHLLDRMPAVADFLALPPGYRFLIHGTYRDIWFDEGLLSA